MESFEIVVPTLFGLEAVAANEIRRLGYQTKRVQDGRVTFLGGARAVCESNLWLRTGDRVLVKVGEFEARTFDELFEGCKTLNWPDYLPKNAAFPVKGFSIKSTLFSVSDCQAIIKKSVAASLSRRYKLQWFPEDGALYQVQFSIIRDTVCLMIDTTGLSLHKRGYRVKTYSAPVRETLAAAMVLLSRWRPDRPFADICCGSGTIPIEAAMIARNIAPGLNRGFAGEQLGFLPKPVWEQTRESARAAMRLQDGLMLHASDIDPQAGALTQENCVNAGVSDVVRVQCADAADFHSNVPGGTIICNPPYGVRLGEAETARRLYAALGKAYLRLDGWTFCALTADTAFEKSFGRHADKKRKLYNGMLKCDLYQYFSSFSFREKKSL